MKLNKWNENIDRHRRSIRLGSETLLRGRSNFVCSDEKLSGIYETKPRGDDVEIYLQGDSSNLSGK